MADPESCPPNTHSLVFQSCLAPGNDSWLIYPNSMMFSLFLASLAAKDGHEIQFWPSMLGQGKDLEKKTLFSRSK